MAADTADLLTRLGQTATECRQLIREMHEAQRDLRQTIRDADEARRLASEAVEDLLATEFRDIILGAVAAAINELSEHNQRAMRETSAKIIAEFDKIAIPLCNSLGMIEEAAAIRKRRHLEAGR